MRGTVADSTGKFVLSPLVQSSTNGNYDVVIVDNNPAGGHATGVIRSVPVTASTTTTVATSGQPITLAASVTRKASGTATAAAQASVAALQTIGTASYEITSTNADLTTGAYTLNLPAATPVAGTYSTTLPIALAPAGTAGAYTIQATSSTGAVQSSPANVAAADQSGINFNF